MTECYKTKRDDYEEEGPKSSLTADLADHTIQGCRVMSNPAGTTKSPVWATKNLQLKPVSRRSTSSPGTTPVLRTSARTRSLLIRLFTALLCFVALSGPALPAHATTANLANSKDLVWYENGTRRTMRAYFDVTINDSGAYGSITGHMTGRTYGQSNFKICTRAVIQLWAQIATPSSLRPELNQGWNLVDVRVVGTRKNLFIYHSPIRCNSNSYAAGLSYPSTNPLRWSSSPWRVYQASVQVITWNTYSNGATAKSVSTYKAAAV